MTFFTAYLFADTYQCLYLIRDTTSPGAIQTYMHHFIGIFGSVTALVVGRMILSLSAISCWTEFSTPFVNLRALLHMHKKSSSTLYIVNGLLMTVSFGIVRCLFQTWLVATRLVPSVLYRADGMLAESSKVIWGTMYVSTLMYLCLCLLNYFWFSKMVNGLLKFFLPDKKKATAG